MLHVKRFYISIIIIRMSFSASNNFIIVVIVVVPRVCVCVPVRSFFSATCIKTPTCVFTAAQKTLLYIIIVIFAENASFKSYGVICLL